MNVYFEIFSGVDMNNIYKKYSAKKNRNATYKKCS